MDIKILVSTHKKYVMPKDSIYIPIQSGSDLYPDLGYQKDNEGVNISSKNPAYNEMCVMFWGWKNIKSDYMGLVHYRRHFTLKKKKRFSIEDVISKKELETVFQKNDIILPPKRHYPFFTIKSHYIYTKKGYTLIHKRDFNVLENIIFESYPQYLKSFNLCMKRSYYHGGHLCLMKKEFYDDYCEFIFSIGKELEHRLNNERKDLTRYVSALTELLMDVWIDKNDYNYKELPIIEFEKPPFIVKLFNLIRRTLTGYYKGT